MSIAPAHGRLRSLPPACGRVWPGMAVAVAIAAKFLSDHYGAPSMPMALLPGFVLAFLGPAALNSLGFVSGSASDLSRWALLAGIVAVGMETSFGRVLEVGGDAVALILAETLFMGLFIHAGIYYLGYV